MINMQALYIIKNYIRVRILRNIFVTLHTFFFIRT